MVMEGTEATPRYMNSITADSICVHIWMLTYCTNGISTTTTIQFIYTVYAVVGQLYHLSQY